MKPIALSASTITGDKVRNRDGEALGHLEEVVIDLESGRVSYGVLESGGFLGLGGKLFAVPWSLMEVDTDNEEIVIDVSKESLENAPGFDKDNWPDTTERSWMVEVFEYYGSDPYWDQESNAGTTRS